MVKRVIFVLTAALLSADAGALDWTLDPVAGAAVELAQKPAAQTPSAAQAAQTPADQAKAREEAERREAEAKRMMALLLKVGANEAVPAADVAWAVGIADRMIADYKAAAPMMIASAKAQWQSPQIPAEMRLSDEEIKKVVDAAIAEKVKLCEELKALLATAKTTE